MSIISNIPFKPITELEFALKAVIKARQEILEIYKDEISFSKKSDDSPITEADLKSNQVINEILSETGYQILSEEAKDDLKRLEQKTVWIVDPLDGTTDFIKKTGEFTIMVALVQNKQPILGIICWPTENTFFIAQKNAGAYRYSNMSWQKISVSDTFELSKCKVVGSRFHLSVKEKDFIKKLGIPSFLSIGSSLKVAKISLGEADVYITFTDKMKEWDTAASYCIITEAGGKMTDMLGNDLSYNNKNIHHQNGILATNGKVHEKILSEYDGLQVFKD